MLAKIDLSKASSPQSLHEAIITQSAVDEIGTPVHLASLGTLCYSCAENTSKCRGYGGKRQMSSQVRYSRQSWLLLDREISPVLATWDIRFNKCALTMSFTPIFFSLSR